MDKSRLETFTDSVVAIAMTIMVLNLDVPASTGFAGLWDLRFQFLIYGLSFLTLAIYWKNHHHMFSRAKVISNKVLWLNIIFVFFLTLFTFTTAWVDSNILALAPELTYGTVTLLTNLSFAALSLELARANGTKALSIKRSQVTILINIAALLGGLIYPPLILIGCMAILVMWAFPLKLRSKSTS
jgi:uncharacterized membrane protein